MTHLSIRKGVVLNAALTSAIEELDSFFAAGELTAVVTSGIRTPEDQLRIIQQYAAKHGVDEEFPWIRNAAVESRIEWVPNHQERYTLGAGEVSSLWYHQIYTWQQAWSRLLNIGVIISPVKTAVCLYDYRHPRNPRVNKVGKVIGESNHYSGKAFDIGGGQDGIEGVIANELAVVAAAVDSGQAPFIRSYLAERVNNCVHIDIA